MIRTTTMTIAQPADEEDVESSLDLAQQEWEMAQNNLNVARIRLQERPCQPALSALAVARAREEAAHREIDRLTAIARGRRGR